MPEVWYELVNNDRIVGGIDDDSSNCASSHKSFIKGNVLKLMQKQRCANWWKIHHEITSAFTNEISSVAYQEGINDRAYRFGK